MSAGVRGRNLIIKVIDMKKFVVLLLSVVIVFSFSGSAFADDDATAPDTNASEQMIPSEGEAAPPVVTVPESVTEPAPIVEPTLEPASDPASEAAPEQPDPEPAPESQ